MNQSELEKPATLENAGKSRERDARKPNISN